MHTNIDTHNTEQLAGAVYFAVGRGTEGGGASYHLSITGITNPSKATDPRWGDSKSVIAASGYSLGAIQVDLGQRGMWPVGSIDGHVLRPGEKTYVRAIVDEAGQYAKDNKLPFTNDLNKLSKDLLTNGKNIHFIDIGTRDSINAWASSKKGMQWIHQNIDLPQVTNATNFAVEILDKHGKGILEKDRFEAICIIAKTANQSPSKVKILETTLDKGGNIADLHQTISDIKHKTPWFAAGTAATFANRYEQNYANSDMTESMSRAHAKVMSSAYDPSAEKLDVDIQTALKATFEDVNKTIQIKASNQVGENTQINLNSEPNDASTTSLRVSRLSVDGIDRSESLFVGNSKPQNSYPIADWSDRSQPIREYNQQDGTSKLYTFNSDGVPIREQQLDVNGVDINQKILPDRNQQLNVVQEQSQQPQMKLSLPM
jgi:hypothetical protein